MRRTKLALGILSVLLALGSGQLAPSMPAVASQAGDYRAASPEYGMSVFLYGNADTTTRDLEKLQTLGFGWQKSLFSWRDLEGECKGCFTWDEADRIVLASAEAGLKIMARLDFQPGWARADGAANGPPDRYQDFADFVRAFVDRYKKDSDFGTVHAIQVWNEVNLDRESGRWPYKSPERRRLRAPSLPGLQGRQGRGPNRDRRFRWIVADWRIIALRSTGRRVSPLDV